MSLRIAMVLHGWPGRRAGGTGMVVQALASALRSLGHAVCIVVREDTLESEAAEKLGIEVLPLRPRAPASWQETWAHPEIDLEFERMLRRWSPDVVHIHHLSGLSFSLIDQAISAGAQTVLTLHDYAMVCVRGQLVTHEGLRCEGPSGPDCGRCMAQLSPLGPRGLRVGNLVRRIPGAERSARSLLSRLPRPITDLSPLAQERITAARAALNRVHRLEAPSHDLCARLEAMGMRRPVHAPLPLVQELRYAPRSQPGPLRFLFLGSLIPTKGPDRLLEAFSRLEPGSAKLGLAGDEVPFFNRTDFLEKLRARAARTPGVQWLGSVEPSSMQALLEAYDVLVLPSTWPENSPLVVREATAVGLRIIVSSIGGASELDPDARCVHPDRIDELENSLREELERGPARNPARHWPDPLEVAQWHIDHSYSRDSGQDQSTIGG